MKQGRGKKKLKRDNLKRDNYVCGRNCLKELLLHKPDVLRHIYCTEQAKEIVETASVPITVYESKDLSELLGTESHQGVAALVERDNLLGFKELLKQVEQGSVNRILALDGVQDAHNLGAILRSAECFGIDAVLWSSSRSVSLSPVVSKVSMGASELLMISQVGNLGDALLKLKKEACWLVLADVDEDAVELTSFSFPEKVCLVLGSEGSGAKQRIKKLCDETIYIGQKGRLQSLNVSQACSVILYQLSR